MQVRSNIPLPLRLLFICVFFSTCLYAQKEIDKKVNQVITKAMAEEAFPGMAVAVIQHNKVLFEKGYGFTSSKQKATVDEQTIFSIGSVSKAFTGIGVMLLVQQGRIVLDNPVKKYMKDLPKAWGDITIRQFMTHSSGIPELKGEKDNASFEQTLKGAAALPMAFTPGKKQQYNNFNFAILGKLIETVSGISYLEYMNKSVFQPLKMDHTGVGITTRNVAMGHLLKNGQWKEIESHFRPGDYGVPAGGLQTTLTDFIKLSQALNKNTLLSAKTAKAMWTPYSPKLSNTPGWHSRMAGRDIVIHKGGGGTGIGSVCDYKIVPSQELYVIVMANKANNKISPANITDEILWKCFNIPQDVNGAGAGEGDEH